MTPKPIIRAAFCVLAAVGIGSWAWKTFSPKEASPAEEPEVVAIQREAQVIVTYFTSDKRCITCKKIEQQTHDAVTKGFHQELTDGTLAFRTINYERPEHEHFVDDYQLAFKTVVISRYRDGEETHWEKYDKVWELVDSPNEFSKYLTEAITSTINTDA